MVRTLVIPGLIAMATAASAAAPAPGRQEAYDAAQAAFDRGDWPGAIAGFTRLLPPDGRRASASEAIIRGRLAQALLNANRLDEARATARQAVSELAKTGGAEEVAAWLTLGDVERFSLRMAEAVAAYSEAEQRAKMLGNANGRITAEYGIALATVVTDPARSAAATDRLLGDTDLLKSASETRLALLESLRGLAELNRSNPRASLPFFTRAVEHSGGLGHVKVNLAQVSIRGSAAIAHQLLGNDDQTRTYLAYTGAGRNSASGWLAAGNLTPPTCGGAAGLRPDDTAVVEFTIGPDGRVTGVQPIYASRPGQVGIAFAQAVRDWRWEPEAAKKIDLFWRLSVRMQVRCLTRPEPESMGESFARATAEWLRGKGVPDQELDIFNPDSRFLPKAPETLPADFRAVAPLFVRLRGAEGAEHRSSAGELQALLDRLAAPAEAQALFIWWNAAPDSWRDARAFYRSRADHLAAALPGARQRFPGTRSLAWLEAEYAVALETTGDFTAARPRLEAIGALPTTVLPAGDPIRTVVLTHLAGLDARAGDRAAAEQRLADAGIGERQCSLVDLRPVHTGGTVTSNDFPAEALRWGFEGFVRVAYDIAADGRTRDVRSVLAYPPFVFVPATERAVARFRFVPPATSAAASGCSGQTQNVRYAVP